MLYPQFLRDSHSEKPLPAGRCILKFIFALSLGSLEAPHVPISSLLVSGCGVEALRDVRHHVTLISGVLSHPTPLSAPPDIKKRLSHVIGYSGLLNLERPDISQSLGLRRTRSTL